jgi:hypothetical protein
MHNTASMACYIQRLLPIRIELPALGRRGGVYCRQAGVLRPSNRIGTEDDEGDMPTQTADSEGNELPSHSDQEELSVLDE